MENRPASFSLKTRFVEQMECEKILSEVESFVHRAYTDKNLLEHKAYLSDVADGRTSFAFTIDLFGNEADSGLPAFPAEDLPPRLRALTEKIATELRIDRGRILFNVQSYECGSAPLPTHFDGEYFEFESADDGFTVFRALRPRRVAVLTLKNAAENGGTILVPEAGGRKRFVWAGQGDLLIFDNKEFRHRVDSLQRQDESRAEDIIRYTIGWRALDDECTLFDRGSERTVSYSEARQLHQEFLDEIWRPNAEAIIATTEPPF